MVFGGYLQVGASLCGGWAYSYLCRLFRQIALQIGGMDVTEERVYERMGRLAAQTAKGASGLVADTRFGGTRDDPGRRGSFAHIDHENLNPANLVRATMEGVVEELAAFSRLVEKPLKRIVAGGNFVRMNPLLLQLIEQHFGVPCRFACFEEEAALGAAFTAAVGLGLMTREQVNGVVGGP